MLVSLFLVQTGDLNEIVVDNNGKAEISGTKTQALQRIRSIKQFLKDSEKKGTLALMKN